MAVVILFMAIALIILLVKMYAPSDEERDRMIEEKYKFKEQMRKDRRVSEELSRLEDIQDCNQKN